MSWIGDFIQQIPNVESISLYIGIILSIGVGIAIALLIRAVLRRGFMPRLPRHIYNPIEKIVIYSVIIVAVISALAPLGLDLSGLLLTGGVIGVAIGFASQTVISNALSGVFIYMERMVKVGDPIRVEDAEGRVIDITLFSTVIRCWDGYIVRVPNSKVFDSLIYNFEKSPIRRIALKVGIGYGVDIDLARRLIIGVMEEHPYILVNPGPEVFVDEFGDSAIVLNVRCWAPSTVWFDVRKYLLEAIKKVFDKEGVEIPYPQRVVWIREDK